MSRLSAIFSPNLLNWSSFNTFFLRIQSVCSPEKPNPVNFYFPPLARILEDSVLGCWSVESWRTATYTHKLHIRYCIDRTDFYRSPFILIDSTRPGLGVLFSFHPPRPEIVYPVSLCKEKLEKKGRDLGLSEEREINSVYSLLRFGAEERLFVLEGTYIVHTITWGKFLECGR
jgi:hypothetical protein